MSTVDYINMKRLRRGTTRHLAVSVATLRVVLDIAPELRPVFERELGKLVTETLIATTPQEAAQVAAQLRAETHD